RRLPDPRASGARRRAARLRDGRQAALAGPRRAAATRDPRHVRLQEREVAAPDRARAPRRQRLLGAARGRPRRGGRPLPRIRDVRRYVRRFSRPERALHGANAAVSLVLLASGLALYLPSLALLVGRRPLVKDVHFWSGVAWIPLLCLVVLAGDRRGIVR